MIAQVVASERAGAQTLPVTAGEGLEDYIIVTEANMNRVGNLTIEGDSPVKISRRER